MSYVLHNEINNTELLLDDSLESVISNAIDRDDIESLLIIVPTGRRVRLLRRMIIRRIAARHGKPAGAIPLYTLESFVRMCGETLLGPARPRIISPAYALALMEEAAGKANLRFFCKRGETLMPSVLERLANIVFGLKEDGVTPRALREDVQRALSGEDNSIDAARLGDILALYEAYERLLGGALADYLHFQKLTTEKLRGPEDNPERRGIDAPAYRPGDVTQRLNELFPRLEQAKKRTLIMDGFSEFKSPELDFIALFVHAPFHVRIHLDYSERNGPLFANLQETLERLVTVGYQAKTADADIELQPGYSREGHLPLVSYLRRYLFNTDEEIRRPEFDDIVTVIGLENRVEEARAIVKLTKHIASTENIALDDMCVVMRQPELYTGLFHEFCAEYGVPANITDRFPLSASPVATAVFSALDIVLGGYRRADVHRALQSPYLRFMRRIRGVEVPLQGANLFSTARRLRITGGFRRGAASNWIGPLEKRMEFLRKRSAALDTEPYPDMDEAREVQRELTETTNAFKDFEALASYLPDPELKMTPEEFSDLINRDILRQFQVRESILDFHRQAKSTARNPAEYRALEQEVEKDARAFAALVKLVEEQVFVYKERFPGKKRSVREFADRLRTAIGAERYQVREKLGYGVTFTSIEQIRNIPFRITILCGAVDGEFPAVYVPESFLGKELPETEDRFLKNERLQFYLALTNNHEAFKERSKRVYITYPQYREDRELVRSPFVDALLKVSTLRADVSVFDAQSIRRLRALPAEREQSDWHKIAWLDALASEEEAVRQIGIIGAQALDTDKEAAKETMRRIADGFHDDRSIREAQRMVEVAARRAPHVGPDRNVRIDPQRLTHMGRKKLDALARARFSVSALEQYAQCPYQFFAQRVLALRREDEFEVFLSPLERGSFLHKILYRFYRELQSELLADPQPTAIKARVKAAPLAPVALDPQRYDDYAARLRRIATQELQRIAFDHPFFDLDKEELLGTDQIPGKLELWLREELRRIESPWLFQPALFELSFGERSRMSDQQGIAPVPLAGDALLQGKIDRLEMRFVEIETGETAVEFLIADYKSGPVHMLPGNAEIEKGIALQMPLYIAAAEQILREVYDIEASALGAVYYSLSPTPLRDKHNQWESHRFVLMPKDSFLGQRVARKSSQVVASRAAAEELVSASVARAAGYIDAIAAGRFDVAPYDAVKVCAYCSFGAVCRISSEA